MKQLKFAIAGFGLLGAIGIFLPMVEAFGRSLALWDARTGDAAGVYITLAGFVVGLAAGVMGIVKGPMKRQFAGVATVGFALSVLKLRDGFSHFGDYAIGGKLMLASAALGLIVSIVATVKPEEE